jgi:effector-binding domain-containing protein
VHTGDYEGLWDAYPAILLWIATNGYQVVGPCRIFYLRMVLEGEPPISEIQIPVEKVQDTY